MSQVINFHYFKSNQEEQAYIMSTLHFTTTINRYCFINFFEKIN